MLDVAGGTNVCQWTYGGGTNQRWIFEAASNMDEGKKTEFPSNPRLKLD